MHYQGFEVAPKVTETNKNVDNSEVTVLIDKNISTCYQIEPTRNTGQLFFVETF